MSFNWGHDCYYFVSHLNKELWEFFFWHIQCELMISSRILGHTCLQSKAYTLISEKVVY